MGFSGSLQDDKSRFLLSKSSPCHIVRSNRISPLLMDKAPNSRSRQVKGGQKFLLSPKLNLPLAPNTPYATEAHLRGTPSEPLHQLRHQGTFLITRGCLGHISVLESVHCTEWGGGGRKGEGKRGKEMSWERNSVFRLSPNKHTRTFCLFLLFSDRFF